MRDDIDQARRAGYSDEQILSVLGETNPSLKNEIQGAVQAGYQPNQIISVVQENNAQAKRDAIKNQSWGSYATDLAKSVIYGAGQDAKNIGTTLSQTADATGPKSSVNAAGDALQSGGQLVTNMAAGYQPAQFDVSHPIDTISELPKAAGEAAPGILAAVGSGALGGMVAGPIGATIGGLAGAGAYGLARYWGGNSNARAQAEGRDRPTQADFDNTLAPSVAQAGIDAVSMKLGGLAGKGIGSTVARPIADGIGSTTGRLVGQAAGVGAESAVIGAAGGVNSALGQVAEGRSVSDLDWKEIADAAGTGVGVRGVIGAARAPAEVVGAVKYNPGSPLNAEAVSRVIQHMSTDAFPGNPRVQAETAQNLRMARSRYGDSLSEIVKNADIVGVSPEGKIALQDAQSLLRSGAVYSEKQLGQLQTAIGNEPAFRAAADLNAVNWMNKTAGGAEGRSMVERLIGGALRNPGKAGGIGAALAEGLPLITGGLNVMSGGKIAASAIAAKALSKATGFDSVLNDPLGQIADRYVRNPSVGPEASYPSGAETVQQFRQARAGQEMARGANPAPSPELSPNGPSSRPAGGSSTNPIPPELLRPSAPVNQTPHTSLAEAMGAPEPQFQARPAVPQSANRGAMMPEGGPVSRVPRPMSSSDILTEMKIQAAAENQPLLDVAHLHHRSSRSIADNPLVPEPIRAQAKAQASDIWHNIITGLEAEASPAEIKRARSAKTVDAGPAAPPTLSVEGEAMLRTVIPDLATAIQTAPTQGAATRAVEQAVSKFKGSDKALVRDALAKSPEIVKATSLSELKRTATGSKAIKAARKSAAKLAGPGKGGKRGPRGPRKP